MKNQYEQGADSGLTRKKKKKGHTIFLEDSNMEVDINEFDKFIQ